MHKASNIDVALNRVIRSRLTKLKTRGHLISKAIYFPNSKLIASVTAAQTVASKKSQCYQKLVTGNKMTYVSAPQNS